MADAASLILRVAVGIAIGLHGLYKFQMKSVFDAKWQQDYGFPQGTVLLTGIVQVACGLALVAGVFTRIAALILLGVMVVATYLCVAKHHEPFLSTPQGKGWDVNLLLLASLAALVLLGDGKWSLAQWWLTGGALIL
jgi:putative oxidoreductase